MAKHENVGELERELQAIAQRLEVGKRHAGRSNSEIKPGRRGNCPVKQVSVALKPLTRNPSSSDAHRDYVNGSDKRPSIKDRIRAVLNAPATPTVSATAHIPQKCVSPYAFSQVPHHTPHLSLKSVPRTMVLTPVKLRISFVSGCDWSRLRPTV